MFGKHRTPRPVFIGLVERRKRQIADVELTNSAKGMLVIVTLIDGRSRAYALHTNTGAAEFASLVKAVGLSVVHDSSQLINRTVPLGYIL